MKKLFAGVGLLLVGVLTTAFSCSYELMAGLDGDFPYTQMVEQTYEFSGKTRFTLANDVGDVLIRGWDQSTVQMVATIRAKRERYLAQAEIEVIEENTSLMLSADHPDHQELNWMVDFELYVPNQADVYVEQGVGEIEILDLTGLQKVTLGAGEMTLTNVVTSTLQAHLGAGELEVVDLLAQSVDLDVGTGELELTPQAAAVFDSVRVSMGTGQVELFGIQADTIDASVGIGELSIGLKSDASYVIQADVGMGDLSIRGFDNMDVDKDGVMGRTVRGTIGDGVGRLQADVGMGNLRVYAQD